jgi:hypothetical protein
MKQRDPQQSGLGSRQSGRIALVGCRFAFKAQIFALIQHRSLSFVGWWEVTLWVAFHASYM